VANKLLKQFSYIYITKSLRSEYVIMAKMEHSSYCNPNYLLFSSLNLFGDVYESHIHWSHWHRNFQLHKRWRIYLMLRFFMDSWYTQWAVGSGLLDPCSKMVKPHTWPHVSQKPHNPLYQCKPESQSCVGDRHGLNFTVVRKAACLLSYVEYRPNTNTEIVWKTVHAKERSHMREKG
jgi:hypothetical protein